MNANTPTVSDAQAAANKFLALNSGNLAAALEAFPLACPCATACHFDDLTGDP